MTIEELFNELKTCNLFIGCYDAKHGNEHFMYGIETVMEYIASKISDETAKNFADTFFQNMIDSGNKR